MPLMRELPHMSSQRQLLLRSQRLPFQYKLLSLGLPHLMLPLYQRLLRSPQMLLLRRRCHHGVLLGPLRQSPHQLSTQRPQRLYD